MPRAARRATCCAVHFALALWLLFACVGEVCAEQLPIKIYTSAEGLAHDRIQRIRRDSRGFLWFCTIDGLSRFDGYRFINYNAKQGLPHSDIMDILETRDGRYWLGTFGAGACLFNPTAASRNLKRADDPPDSADRFISFPVGDNALTNEVRVLFEDHAGRIWAGTTGGLFRLEERDGAKAFRRIELNLLSPADRSMRVFALAEDGEGALWVATSKGLFRILPNARVVYYKLGEASDSLPATSLLLDSAGRLWVGTGGGVIVLRPEAISTTIGSRGTVVRQLKKAERFAKGSLPALGSLFAAGDYRWLTTADGLTGDEVGGLIELPNQRIWISTRDHGLTQFDGKQFQPYTTAQGLSSNDLSCLAEDREGNLWVGTQTSGAMKLSSNGFTSYTEKDGLDGIYIISIFEERAGRLCMISYPRTLNVYDGRRFVTVRPNIPDPAARLVAQRYETLFEDREGEWWVPTGSRLYRFARVDDPERLARAKPKAVYTTREGLASNSITRLFEDRRGDLWIGSDSQNPLTRWERATGKFTVYTQADGLPPNNPPSAYLEDDSGNLWMGLLHGGLVRYRRGRFELFKEEDGVAAGLIRQIFQDHNRQLWFAAEIGGLGRIEDADADRPRFAAYTTAQGLASNNVRCLTEDRFGRLYVGTVGGIDRLDLATNGIKHYTKADGLSYTELGTAFCDRDGGLWFGMWRGLSRLMPQPEQPLPTPVFISGLRLTGDAFPIADNGEAQVILPELQANNNQLEIEFLGLDFSPGEALRYQFKLEGAGGDWTPPTDQRSVNYPNLPPGAYRFLVRAISANGMMSDAPAVVGFRVLPPVWRRWWFIVLAVILVAIPFVAIARYRQQRMKAVREAEEALRKSREERLRDLERVRRRIATDLHDDIGSSLTQISILSEVARQRINGDDAQLSAPLAMIAGASRELIDAMSDIVWAINPQKDHLSDLTQRMRRFASDVLTARSISFAFREPAEEEDVQLGASIRREVFLIFKESINNMVRHAGCTTAEIDFQIAAGALNLEVSDNGKGFDPAQQSEGHGLLSMRQRTEALGGRFEIASRQGEGTRMRLELPLAGQS